MSFKGEPTAKITISKWFSKKSELEPSEDKLKIIAQILEVPLKEILIDENYVKNFDFKNKEKIKKLNLLKENKKILFGLKNEPYDEILDEPSEELAKTIYQMARTLNLGRQVEVLSIVTRGVQAYNAEKQKRNEL